MPTKRHMIIFVALYENKGNTTKAAESLYMAQPAVSLALSELEKYYGCNLFERISKRLYITDAGKRFYRYAKRIVDMFDDVEKGMKSPSDCLNLRIGCCDSADACTLPKFILNFNEIHPGVIIRSNVDTAEALEEKILSNELDLAIIDNAINSNKILSKQFIAAEIGLGVSPNLGYTDEQTFNIEWLIRQPLLLKEMDSGARTAFDNALSNKGFSVNPILESISTAYLLNAAVLGMGIAVLPKTMMNNLHNKGKLVYINIQDMDFTLVYRIIHHKDKELTEIMKDFIEMLSINKNYVLPLAK